MPKPICSPKKQLSILKNAPYCSPTFGFGNFRHKINKKPKKKIDRVHFG